MSRKESEWQKHVAPFLRKAVKQARKTYKPKNGLTAAQKRSLKAMQKRRDELNDKIRKMKGN